MEGADRSPGNLPPATFGGNGFAVLPEFSIAVRELPQLDVHVVALSGELDIVSAGFLTDALVEAAASTVVVDLSDLTFMDCRGIGALVAARNSILASGLGQLVVVRPSDIVRQALHLVGLSELIVEETPRTDASRSIEWEMADRSRAEGAR
jgi:anti-anti-sigma factor